MTGASSGIGLETARALARLGARVVMVCRDPARAEAARVLVAEAAGDDGAAPIVLLADLADLAAVRRLGDEVDATVDRLDVLVNNAGVLVPTRRTSPDGIELTLATNHLSMFVLTDRLLGLLGADGGGRVVTVSSEAHRAARLDWSDLQAERSYSAFRAYGRSKLMNLLFTVELARRTAGTGVTANALHPGVIASGFWRGVGGPLGLAAKVVKPFMTSPEAGAATSVYLAASPDVAGISGRYFAKQREKTPSGAARDADDARRLWDVSQALVGAGAPA